MVETDLKLFDTGDLWNYVTVSNAIADFKKSLVSNKLRPVSTSMDPKFNAPDCDCLWHPRRLPGISCAKQDKTNICSSYYELVIPL